MIFNYVYQYLYTLHIHQSNNNSPEIDTYIASVKPIWTKSTSIHIYTFEVRCINNNNI